jgi:hypothetical protein
MIGTDEPLIPQSRVSFTEVFPMVSKIVVEIEDVIDGNFHNSKKIQYTETHFKNTIECSNDGCIGGGFRFQEIIDKMVRARETHLKRTLLHCGGWVGDPKGIVQPKPCRHCFFLSITITYRD